MVCSRRVGKVVFAALSDRGHELLAHIEAVTVA
jgi:hypothetical protein